MADSSSRAGRERILANVIFDRAVAVVAVLPFVYVAWQFIRSPFGSFEGILVLAQLAVIAVTMVTRHPPKRVTRNPLFWVLAVAATYWGIFMAPLYTSGGAVVPKAVSVGIAILAFSISVWARLSLGRNIGFVPAERTIVTTGAYAFVRHPIYTGLFVGIIAGNLAGFAWRNVVLNGMWISLWIIKTFVEESFLKDSLEYQRYMGSVRWRWVPGIA